MNDSPIAISVYRCPERLHTPYVLSFGTVEQLDTYYVMVEGGGRVGFGEITPLPGYSDESAETVEAALADTMLKFGTADRRGKLSNRCLTLHSSPAGSPPRWNFGKQKVSTPLPSRCRVPFR